MKKKSILFSLTMLVAVLFSSTAMAQFKKGTWPADNTGIKSFDSIYFCQVDTLIHPIEMGYDVPGLNLSPEYGKWDYVASLSYGTNGLTEYDADVRVNSVAAGNVFNVPNLVGAYVFEYTSSSSQCGLGNGDIARVYVFVLPDISTGLRNDTSICKSTGNLDLAAGKTPVEYVKYADVFKLADIKLVSTPNVFTPALIDKSIVADYLYEFNITVTPEKGATNVKRGYKCGNSFKFNFKVSVTDEISRPSVHGYSCDIATDIRTLEEIMGYDDPNYVYTPTTLAGLTWVTKPGGNGEKFAEIDFKLSNAACAISVKDTIWDYKDGLPNALADYATSYCKLPGDIRLLDNFVPLNTPAHVWEYWGETGTAKKANLPNDPFSDDEIKALSDFMNTGTDYFFKYIATSSGVPNTSCLVGLGGMLKISLDAAFVPRDFRVQICSDVDEFNLDLFTGLNKASWVGVSNTLVWKGNDPTSRIIEPVLGINKLKYTQPNVSCGGGEGVLYIKKGKSAVIADKWEEKFCVTNNPSIINVNDLIGYLGNSWTLSDANGDATLLAKLLPLFNAASGQFQLKDAKTEILKVTDFTSDFVLTFKLTGASCVNGGNVELKVILTQTL